MAFSCADEFAHSVAERVKIIEVCHGVVAEEPDTLEGRVVRLSWLKCDDLFKMELNN
jgi:hypothetical protein